MPPCDDPENRTRAGSVSANHCFVPQGRARIPAMGVHWVWIVRASQPRPSPAALSDFPAAKRGIRCKAGFRIAEFKLREAPPLCTRPPTLQGARIAGPPKTALGRVAFPRNTAFAPQGSRGFVPMAVDWLLIVPDSQNPR